MKPYAVRVPSEQLSEIERWGGKDLYRISQWFYLESVRNPGCFFYMGAVDTNGRDMEERRMRHNLYRDAYEYAGFAIFDSDDDAYAHWLQEYAPLDPCYDWSDQGKGSGQAYLKSSDADVRAHFMHHWKSNVEPDTYVTRQQAALYLAKAVQAGATMSLQGSRDGKTWEDIR